MMAPCRPLSPSCLVSLLLVTASLVGSKTAVFEPVKQWGQDFGAKLRADLDQVSNFEKIRGACVANAALTKSVEVDYEQLLKTTMTSMETLLRQRADALNLALEEAEKIANQFPFDSDGHSAGGDEGQNDSGKSRLGWRNFECLFYVCAFCVYPVCFCQSVSSSLESPSSLESYSFIWPHFETFLFYLNFPAFRPSTLAYQLQLRLRKTSSG